jgi:vacuolar protein sorting-associated protein 53
MILNTADYCLTTVSQLEDRIKARVDEELRDQIQFDAARESFIQSANSAIRVLLKKVEQHVDHAFKEMVNTRWSDIETVGDHSGYVNEMVRGIKDAVTEITGRGHLRERYIRTLCDRIVEWFGAKFIDSVINCRPICEAGAEQVLLSSRQMGLILDALGCVHFEAGIVRVAGFEYGSSCSATCLV